MLIGLLSLGVLFMDELSKQSWKRYVKIRELSVDEQKDQVLCKKLRQTLDFSLCRLHVAMCNLGNEILRSLGVKR